MEKNIFWDRKTDTVEVKKILSDDKNARFIEFAALLLSRTNDARAVFSTYLDKTKFCKNWRKIKAAMRKNKWQDERIIFWDEIYKTVKENIKFRVHKEKTKPVTSQTKEIGDIIKEARKNKGLTQKELGKKADVSQQLVSFVERGYSNFSFDTLKKIAIALDLKITVASSEESTSKISATMTATATF